MKVVIHDQTEVPGRLRRHAEERLARLSRHWDHILDTEIHFARERKGSHEPAHVVRIVMRMDGRRRSLLKAQESAGDLQAALDLALDNLDRRLLKLKGKITERKTVAREQAVLAGAAAGGVPPARPPQRRKVRLQPRSAQKILSELATGEEAFRVFLDEDGGEVKVAYRRRDGSLAIIEPVIP
ncbi:MAG: ribosome hibernation-promoting factor, HPF/YfiA family [Candidatus Dormibacteraceae bacterium]